MAAVKIPAGDGKTQVTVTAADDQQLTRFLAWFDGEGAKPAKWHNAAVAARAELEARRKPKPAAEPAKQPAQQAARPPATGLATVPAAALALAHDANAINARFAELRESYHVVSPATHVDALPDGFGVSVAFVVANPNADKDGPGDVYSVGKKYGLSAHVIQQIAAAAAVDWDSRLSGRLDDGSDPRYCHYRAVGWAKNYDGTPRQIMGEVEIDARDGSPLIEEIIEKAERRKERYPKDRNDGGESQILELRKFLLRHAETKAQNRATCRGLGVKRAYTQQELKKPFAIARLSYTGYSEDRELRKEFARMGAAAALGGRRSLYGDEPPPALPAAAAAGHAPPPIDDDAGLDAQDVAEMVGDAEFEESGPPDPDPDNGASEPPMREPGED